MSDEPHAAYINFKDALCMITDCDQPWTREYDTDQGWLCFCETHAAEIAPNWQGQYIQLTRGLERQPDV